MKMGLIHEQFQRVQDGSKTIEIRLNDEKRRQLQVGDLIVFEDLTTHQQQTKQVVRLEVFPTFAALYHQYGGLAFGSAKTDSEAKMVADTYQIYAKEQEAAFGALAIHLKQDDTN